MVGVCFWISLRKVLGEIVVRQVGEEGVGNSREEGRDGRERLL